MRLLLLAGVVADLAVGADIVRLHLHDPWPLTGGIVLLLGGAIALRQEIYRPAATPATLMRDK